MSVLNPSPVLDVRPPSDCALPPPEPAATGLHREGARLWGRRSTQMAPAPAPMECPPLSLVIPQRPVFPDRPPDPMRRLSSWSAQALGHVQQMVQAIERKVPSRSSSLEPQVPPPPSELAEPEPTSKLGPEKSKLKPLRLPEIVAAKAEQRRRDKGKGRAPNLPERVYKPPSLIALAPEDDDASIELPYLKEDPVRPESQLLPPGFR